MLLTPTFAAAIVRHRPSAPMDPRVDGDGHGFTSALGDAVVAGPTLTNLSDSRAGQVLQRSGSLSLTGSVRGAAE